MGLLANALGTTMMFLANSWGTFMMSPAGVDTQGRFLGNYWNTIRNALWNPLNLHRFCGHIIFGAAVIAAYAAFNAFSTKDHEEREFSDWMGYVSFLAFVFVIFTIPFGGYWLSREIYSYKQQMGITMFGGHLAWANILLVTLMGALFLGINYYIWQRIDCVEEGHRYRPYAKYVFLTLAICILVYITPHTLDMTPKELKAIGGQQHPVFGNFGVESSKQAAVNMMMVVTVWSLLMMWRSQYRFKKIKSVRIKAWVSGLFIAGAVNIVWLGIYGYYVPANIRVGLMVPMALTILIIIVVGVSLNALMISQDKASYSPSWGKLRKNGYFALFFLAVTITWLMGVGGYMRSSLRLFWHATDIMRDNSPWAYTPTIGFAANVISGNVFFFWFEFLFLVWLTKLGRKRRERPVSEDQSPKNRVTEGG